MRKHVYAVHTILEGRSFFGGCTETVKTHHDPDVFQADLRQIPDELCLRQSTGNSTSPKIDIAPSVLREFHIQGNIGKVKAAARLENPDNFTKAEFLLGDEVQDAIRVDDIDAAIGDRKSRGVALPDFNLAEPRSCR